MSLTRNLLDASEDLSVEEDESCDRNDAGEDKSAPVLVIAEHFGNLLERFSVRSLPNIFRVLPQLCDIIGKDILDIISIIGSSVM